MSELMYDKWGRMLYHPEMHANQGKPWTTTQENYLIEHYELLGPEQVSFALERTIHTIMMRACELRKRGKMPKPSKTIRHKRIRSEQEVAA